MNSFLSAVSADLKDKFGQDLSRVAVVFPNKRASLFMNERLAEQTDKPVWSPSYTTISSLMRSMSELKTADPIELVCRLYPIYCRIKGTDESLDQFFSWGEVMVSDFDDIDKNLVDADQLFRNIKELSELETDFLTEEQKNIKAFFGKIENNRTELQQRFASTWEIMKPLYTEFRTALKSEGLGYEGMVYRNAVSSFSAEALEYDKYAFVGFNVLSNVEKELFRKIKAEGKALFYWDYDHFYTRENKQHEAGLFIRENLKEFGCEFSDDNPIYDNYRNKKITIAKAPTENIQARMLNEWIPQNMTERENETAVVLCDESLLAPVMHSIPDSIRQMNITMGYPLKGTPVSSLLMNLLDLQRAIGNSDSLTNPEPLVDILRHPYAAYLTENGNELLNYLVHNNGIHKLDRLTEKAPDLEATLKPKTSNTETIGWLMETIHTVAQNINRKEGDEEEGDESEKDENYMEQLTNESLFKAYTLLNRLKGLIDDGLLDVNQYTLNKLIYQLVSAQSIPFHGEPAIGLQILGVLETRNLDFRNIIMLSTNEGKLPKQGTEVSFIPYIMRQPYGMTTIERRISVYAYYFYRLLQRAENVTFVYNSTVDNSNKGEQSRFLLQLLAEYPGEISKLDLTATQSIAAQTELCDIEKTDEHVGMLRRRYCNGGYLSPSALNTYLSCPRKFFYRYIRNIQEPEELTLDFDNRTLGLVFHKAAELIYQKYKGKQVPREELVRLTDKRAKPELEEYVKQAINDEMFRLEDNGIREMRFNGVQNLNIEAIVYYLQRLLRMDSKLKDLRIYELESDRYHEFPAKIGDESVKVKVGGRIDRMDIVDMEGDTLRVVDYKTGKENKDIACIGDLFDKEKERDAYALQACLYSSIMKKKEPNLKVIPLLVHINKPKDNTEAILTIDKQTVTDFDKYIADFDNILSGKLSEIFDKHKPFTRATDKQTCEYCVYRMLCEKNL